MCSYFQRRQPLVTGLQAKDSPVLLDQLLFKTRDESLNPSVNRTVCHYFLPVFHLSVCPLSYLEMCELTSAHHILISTDTVPQNTK